MLSFACVVLWGLPSRLYWLFNVVPCPPSPTWFYIVGPERGGYDPSPKLPSLEQWEEPAQVWSRRVRAK